MPLTFNTQFETELQKIIEAQREKMLGELEDGSAVRDIAQYRERVGYLRALGELHAWCEEVESKLGNR